MYISSSFPSAIETEKMLALTVGMQAFLQHQTSVFLATVNAKIECDCTIQTGPPGFVRVFEQKHLAFIDSETNISPTALANIFENPSVGMCCNGFADGKALCLNGTARILTRNTLPPESQPTTQQGLSETDLRVVMTITSAYTRTSAITSVPGSAQTEDLSGSDTASALMLQPQPIPRLVAGGR